MDTDAFAVGYFVDERQVFFEARRPGAAEGIGAGRDGVIGVLEGVDGEILISFVNHPLGERQDYRAVDGVALSACPC